ncbi:MAG: hypothetical protein IT306_14065 [Chloroflexi bacterium]|nr:hypothetical protein [Chloroflexota bacterium]
MQVTRRGVLRGLLAVAAATALPTLPTSALAASVAPLPTPDAPRHGLPAWTLAIAPLQAAGEWTEILPAPAATRLFAPASGALLAARGGELYRSDDAGLSWRSIALPDASPKGMVEVDPTNHDLLFLATEDRVQRSTDGGVTWTTVLASAHPDRPFHEVRVSPADPRTVYAAQYNITDLWLHRSQDGGETWSQLEEWHGTLCAMGVYILTPHPTDPARIFRTAGCYAGRDLSDDLEISTDAGASFQSLTAPRGAFPNTIVGGSGADPLRYYLAANKDQRSGGSLLLTSPDDGASWTTVLEYSGGGMMQGAKTPSVTMTALSYDPSAPGRVFLAEQEKTRSAPGGDAYRVSGSVNGGVDWTLLGGPLAGRVNGLALGIDGRFLFAATEAGVQRLAIG